jgi:hypothetical protein
VPIQSISALMKSSGSFAPIGPPKITGVLAHGLRQRIAEARLADVERMAARLQQTADAAGRRMP